MRVVAVLICVFLCVYLWNNSGISKKEEALIKEGLEYAYFEGQKDALEGDVRIEKDYDGNYQWVKAPFENQKLSEITYHPNGNTSFSKAIREKQNEN